MAVPNVNANEVEVEVEKVGETEVGEGFFPTNKFVPQQLGWIGFLY